MLEKTKTQADRLLIKTLFATDPVNWSRYPDGMLCFINLAGQKFCYSNQQLLDLKKQSESVKAAGKKTAAKRSASSKKPAKKPSAGAAEK